MNLPPIAVLVVIQLEVRAGERGLPQTPYSPQVMITGFAKVPSLQNLLQDAVGVQATEHGAACALFGLKNRNRPRKIPTRTVAFLMILPIRVGPSLNYNTPERRAYARA
jgi:CRISPR/Cas system endoribonuclease Cas6 (RAMP superfamily)